MRIIDKLYQRLNLMTACKYSSNIIAYISHPVLIKVTVYGRRVVAMRKTILRPKRSNRHSFSGVL